MLKHFINLEWKSFIRSASFKTNLALKILMGIGAFFMILYALGLGIGAYFIIKKQLNLDPLVVFHKVLFFYVIFDLVIRYFLQKMPIVNIKPLLYLPIEKSKVVNFGIKKTLISFFNIWHAFLFIPFSIVLITQGYDPLGVLGWHLAIMALVFSNNFINIFVNDKDAVFYTIIGILVLLGAGIYYKFFNIIQYTEVIFSSFYEQPYLAIIPIALAVVLYVLAFKNFRSNFYLDAGLSRKTTEAQTENLEWLDRFGKLSTFLKNDIRLIKRNKRSKTTVLMSVVFIFYGLLFFTGAIKAYDHPIWRVFAGIFVSGGFLFSFGQFVPSWDSAYYKLLMSQNITYRAYLESKWYLMIIATVISTILSVFYLYFGWQAYAAVVAGAIYNLGVNSYLVLWGGAYVKTPIDLTSNKKAFGDKKAFNAKTILLTIPKLIVPLILYGIGYYAQGDVLGYALVVLSGILGFLFKDKVFKIIENLYQTEKYKTIAAYEEKN